MNREKRIIRLAKNAEEYIPEDKRGNVLLEYWKRKTGKNLYVYQSYRCPMCGVSYNMSQIVGAIVTENTSESLYVTPICRSCYKSRHFQEACIVEKDTLVNFDASELK